MMNNISVGRRVTFERKHYIVASVGSTIITLKHKDSGDMVQVPPSRHCVIHIGWR